VPTVEANGQTLYYEVHGEGEPLLAIMGLGTDTLGWALQVGPWSARHRLVIFDNRDVGRSSLAEGPYEVRDMAADALALADALELDPFHLVGISLGGAIAQEVALAAPERVRTLTLCVSWGGSGRWGELRSGLLGRMASAMTRAEQVDFMLISTLSEAFLEDPERLERARGYMLANPHPQPPEAFARQAEAGGRHEARDRLGALRMPVHVIGAERDVLVPVWKSHELAELIPGAKLTVLPGAPHGANAERHEDFNAAVLGFVAEAG
jgi:3-oxoadipate enol-lactonase